MDENEPGFVEQNISNKETDEQRRDRYAELTSRYIQLKKEYDFWSKYTQVAKPKF